MWAGWLKRRREAARQALLEAAFLPSGAPTGQNASAPPPKMTVSVNVGNQAAQGKKPVNTRFTSFAERYVLTRSHLWPADCDVNERAWQTVDDARIVYAMIQKKGQHVDDL